MSQRSRSSASTFRLAIRSSGVELFESWADYEKSGKGHSAACDEAWAPVYNTMIPGSMTSAAWEDTVPGAWFDR